MTLKRNIQIKIQKCCLKKKFKTFQMPKLLFFLSLEFRQKKICPDNLRTINCNVFNVSVSTFFSENAMLKKKLHFLRIIFSSCGEEMQKSFFASTLLLSTRPVFINLLVSKSRLKTNLRVTVPVKQEMLIFCSQHVRFFYLK